MSIMTLELNTPTFEAIARKATTLGRTPGELVAAELETAYGKSEPLSPTSEGQGIRRFFGKARSDHPDPSNNELLDADLAKEYGRGL